MGSRKTLKDTHLQIYPGLNDFSDALQAIPDTLAGHMEKLKDVDAQSFGVASEISPIIDLYFKNRDKSQLLKLNGMLDKVNEVLESKVNTAVLAASKISRQIRRLDTDYDQIRANEIPQTIQYDLNDPAFVPIIPPEKQASARTQARREAREAREARRANAHIQPESRSSTPVNDTPTSSRKRGRGPVSRTTSNQAQFEPQPQHTEQNHPANVEEYHNDEHHEQQKQVPVENGHPEPQQPVEPAHTEHQQEHPRSDEQHQPIKVEQSQAAPPPVKAAHEVETQEQQHNAAPQGTDSYKQDANALRPADKPEILRGNATETTSHEEPSRIEVKEAQTEAKPEPATTTEHPNTKVENQPQNKDAPSVSATEVPSERAQEPAQETPQKEQPGQSEGKILLPPVVMPISTDETENKKPEENIDSATAGVKRKRDSAPKPTNEPVYCYCQQGSYGEMVGCDGPNCEREWFHLECIGLSALPNGQWFCEECRAKRRR